MQPAVALSKRKGNPDMICSPHVFGKIAIEVSPILDRPKYIIMLVICIDTV